METDYERWESNAQKKPDWDGRNRLVCDLIPGHSSVLDVGAGNMTTRDLIPESCRYQPADCVKGCEETILVDFNKGIIPEFDQVFDYAVCSGVMEYVHSPGDFLSQVSEWANIVILSYAVTDFMKDIEARRKQGWFNDLSYMELLNLLSGEKLFSRHIALWHGQVILELKK